MPQKNCKIPGPGGGSAGGGNNPKRPHKSYMDCFGFNPLQASLNNPRVQCALGLDPITGLPLTVFDEQINREKQILETLGELVLFYRKLIVPNKAIDGRRCPVCWDNIRGQARSSCPICNGFGVITNDPFIDKVGGFQFLRNPDRDDNMFYVNRGMAPRKTDSTDIGLMVDHTLKFWTVPCLNCEGKIVNIVDQRDIMVRFMFDPETKAVTQELARYELLDVSYSLTANNKLMHMEFNCKRLDPGIKQQEFALPNFLS